MSDKKRILELALQTLDIETDALVRLKNRLASEDADAFAEAVRMLLGCTGRVVVSGIGKSGHVARKIAATLASTGTPAFFVHPAEAAHGDLGMITEKDVVIAISYSGESSELATIIPVIKRMGTKMIAVSGNPKSSLARMGDVHLNVHVEREACPLNLAPTASTTATLALGDALAVATLDMKDFRESDFARSHPGGALGRRLLTHVSDIMRKGNDVPTVTPDTKVADAMMEITKKGIAMTAVVSAAGEVAGIFTDGDLRRFLLSGGDIRTTAVADVMNPNPRTVPASSLAVEAVSVMEQYRINQLLVTDEAGKLAGALHIHDLTAAKVI